MVKLYLNNKNGFTLLEMLLVLLIVCVLSFGIYTKYEPSLYMFMKKMETYCVIAQQRAYAEKKVISVHIENQIEIEDEIFEIPKGIVCESYSFFYNEKGNVSKAGHVVCKNSQREMKLIFQLGTGRVRIER